MDWLLLSSNNNHETWFDVAPAGGGYWLLSRERGWNKPFIRIQISINQSFHSLNWMGILGWIFLLKFLNWFASLIFWWFFFYHKYGNFLLVKRPPLRQLVRNSFKYWSDHPKIMKKKNYKKGVLAVSCQCQQLSSLNSNHTNKINHSVCLNF